MKEKLTKNIGLKILAIILAALLWLIITNVEDPISSKSFYRVPVEVLNENVIKSLDQVYQVTEGRTIDFTVAARRTVIDELNDSNFVVTADLSKLTDLNTATIKISCPGYDDEVNITNKSVDVIKVNLEQIEEKNEKINVKTKGEPKKGYYVAQKTAPQLITVSGPKSKIDSIAEIITEVDVSGLSFSFRTTAEKKDLKAMDKDGNEIDSSNLKYSDPDSPNVPFDKISIAINIYPTKQVDLMITTIGKPADGYMMTAMDYSPKTVEISGDYSVLNSVQNLTATVDITGKAEDFDTEINLQNALSDGLYLVGDNQTVVVNITIEKAATKDLTLQTGDIEIRNKPDSLNVAFTNTGPAIIRLIGPEDEIIDITAKSIHPYINLSGFTAGTYDVDIDTEISDYFSIVNSPKIRVFLN